MYCNIEEDLVLVPNHSLAGSAQRKKIFVRNLSVEAGHSQEKGISTSIQSYKTGPPKYIFKFQKNWNSNVRIADGHSR